MEVICVECSTKLGRSDSSGIYKHPEDKEGKIWSIICLKCGWKTEPFFHHSDIKLPTKEQLKREWR